MGAKTDTSPLKAAAKHWYFLDNVKGLLILLVFVGHIVVGKVEGSLIRSLIYSFHMPLFIGISGFLFNIDRMPKLAVLLKKYWWRLILPWVIAVVAYYVFLNVIVKFNVTLSGLIMAFLQPYYHLWYVLGVLGYVVSTALIWRVIKGNKYRFAILMAIGIIFAIVSKYELVFGALKGHVSPEFMKVYSVLRIDFKPYNYYMFVLGMLLRNLYEKGAIDRLFKYVKPLAIITLGFFVLVVYNYLDYSRTLYYTMYLCISVPLLIVVLYFTLGEYNLRCKVLEFLGQYSLPIYLYHVFCQLIAKQIVPSGSAVYYVLCVAFFAALCAIVYFAKNVGFINRYIFGSTNSFLKK